MSDPARDKTGWDADRWPEELLPVPPKANAGVSHAPVTKPAPQAANGHAQPRPTPVPGAANRPIVVRKSLEDLAFAKPSEADGSDSELEDIARQAPAWLISMVLHMTFFILLAVIATATLHEPEHEVAAVVGEQETYAETLGDQLIDNSVDYTALDAERGDSLSITPQNLLPVESPLAAPPSIGPIGSDGIFAATDIKAPEIGLALSGRQQGSSRNVLLGKYGGTKTTESAVVSGLKWLAKQQRGDGSWSLQGPYSDGGNEENSLSATAMALLAFQGQGNTHKAGEYSKNVVKGWGWLLKQQHKDGDFFSGGPTHHRLYTQPQCTIALCELYGMTHDSIYREPAERAIRYALRIQDKQGGWRYVPGDDSDTSVTGWFVMALQSARMARLEVPQAALDNIMRYLDSAQEEGGRSYAYTAGTFVTPAVSAEGLLCREYLGWKQYDQRLIDGCTALCQNPVNYRGPDQDVYYWYYATQATHHMEGEIWDKWNKVMRQEVPAHQTQGGPEAGSWDPKGDKWGAYGGRLYVTCLSIYMLEVYYRHLPIYSGYRFRGDVSSSTSSK